MGMVEAKAVRARQDKCQGLISAAGITGTAITK